MIEEFCEKGSIQGQNLFDISEEVERIDVKMRNTTAEYMCTTYCNCPQGTDFTKWDELELN